ncbi:MAG: GNAT family N-acetyltransferase [Nanoarchaeota archaeon]|nr:GNAT family N-acetyltransferase [Nanoarchaeota archaeon]
MKPTIKKADKEDKDALILFRYLLSEYESKIEKSEKLDKRTFIVEGNYTINDLGKENVTFFLVYFRKIPIGYSKLTIKKVNAKMIGHIGAEFVLEEFRKRGIGKRLVKEMCYLIKKKKIKKISVEVYKKNKLSIKFHKKMGFKIIGEGSNKKLYQMEKKLK